MTAIALIHAFAKSKGDVSLAKTCQFIRHIHHKNPVQLVILNDSIHSLANSTSNISTANPTRY
jgi:hypothetical protein